MADGAEAGETAHGFDHVVRSFSLRLVHDKNSVQRMAAVECGT